MKKMVIFLTALAMITGFSTLAFAGIENSSHDLSGGGYGTTEICVFCHVPHNPVKHDATNYPLWNHADTSQTFTLYSGYGTTSSYTGVSTLCLSCHDGVTHIDAFGTTNPAGGSTTIGAVNGNIGTNLSDDHPVMIAYPADGTSGFHNDETVTGDIAKLFNSRIECASCHDPHDTTYTPFLRASNADSAICLDCHDK